MLEVIEDGDMEDWVKVNQSYLGYFSGLTPPAEVYFLSKKKHMTAILDDVQKKIMFAFQISRFPQNSNNCYSEILHTSFLNDACLNYVEIFLLSSGWVLIPHGPVYEFDYYIFGLVYYE